MQYKVHGKYHWKDYPSPERFAVCTRIREGRCQYIHPNHPMHKAHSTDASLTLLTSSPCEVPDEANYLVLTIDTPLSTALQQFLSYDMSQGTYSICGASTWYISSATFVPRTRYDRLRTSPEAISDVESLIWNSCCAFVWSILHSPTTAVLVN